MSISQWFCSLRRPFLCVGTPDFECLVIKEIISHPFLAFFFNNTYNSWLIEDNGDYALFWNCTGFPSVKGKSFRCSYDRSSLIVFMSSMKIKCIFTRLFFFYIFQIQHALGIILVSYLKWWSLCVVKAIICKKHVKAVNYCIVLGEFLTSDLSPDHPFLTLTQPLTNS